MLLFTQNSPLNGRWILPAGVLPIKFTLKSFTRITDLELYIYDQSVDASIEILYDNEMFDYIFHSLLISDCIA
jgi:hypothetical protein